MGSLEAFLKDSYAWFESPENKYKEITMKNSENRILVKRAELTDHVVLIDCTWQRHKEVKHGTWDSSNTILPGTQYSESQSHVDFFFLHPFQPIV